MTSNTPSLDLVEFIETQILPNYAAQIRENFLSLRPPYVGHPFHSVSSSSPIQTRFAGL